METYDDYDYSYDVEENETDTEEDFGDYDQSSNEFDLDIISILSIISKWFIRIGIVIAVILLIYFILTGKIITAFFYILGLVVAFFFGYGFMFLLDTLISAN